jgi:subtilisin family serine protease
MVIKSLLTLLASVFFMGAAFAESNTMIVKLKPGFDRAQFKFMGVSKLEPLVPELGIYAMEVPVSKKAMRSALTSLRNVNGVAYAQEDHKVTRRNVPNDKSFKQQWSLLLDNSNAGVDAVNAWTSFGTGGFDAAGNEIVVAVVDGGVDLTHDDLVENIWVNKGEIPNNGIDDDGNGYVDDISGWNAYNNTGAVESDYHGTHVAGIIGAVGNNGIHGAGINWNVKIMGVNGSSGSTATVLKAYGYVLKQKQLWVSTGGKQGANVVATNSSFGVDYGNCKSGSYPAWNDIYNEMGKVGILHAIATANIGMDIDKNGDVPTGCDSPYILAVTNTEKSGAKNSGAGFGLTMIDLGAPGTNIYSTIENNGWGSLTGTSMATPHVAGAVAYMHSAGSKAFNEMYLKDPSAGALALKEIMLKTVTPAASMAGKTVSGGILNLNGAAQGINSYVEAN